MTIQGKPTLDSSTQKNVDSWLAGPYDIETKNTIKKMLEENPQEATDSFYTTLDFGTGGLRGIMGVGTNRMNRYTVMAATQGFANYIKRQPEPQKGHAIFIGYDSRHNSREFAEDAAKVLAGNGIRVYLFDELRPTPLVSFGCRFKECSGGIMITASHNPPEYNGYKVFWNDGAQVLPPHDANIIAEVRKITTPSQVKSTNTLNHPLILLVHDEIDQAYLAAIEPLRIDPLVSKAEGFKLKIIYTSLHGAGITMVPAALMQAGFTTFGYVEAQTIPDGNFPTVKSPNPEEKTALKLGIEKLREVDGDLLIATDPDTDRVGIAVKHQGDIRLLTGNQIAVLCLYYILESLSHQNNLPPKAAFIKTIATTELFQEICHAYQKPCFNVLTGFKYIAEKIRLWEQNPNRPYEFVFGGEESYGYLLGTLVRDKDAVASSILIAEAALHTKLQSKTLVDLLHEIYRKYGFYYEKLLSINFEESKAGKEKMKAGIERLQHTPPSKIHGIEVVSIDDYERSIATDLKTGKTKPIELPKTKGLLFWLQDGSKLLIRPSGTEPKIKIYCGVRIKEFKMVEEAESQAEQHAAALLEALRTLLH